MSNWTALVASGTTTTNPAPSSLATPNPFPSTYIDGQAVSSAWTSQANKGIFPIPVREEHAQTPLQMHFIPSAGASVTFSITLWRYDRLSATWGKPANSSTNSYQGDSYDKISAIGTDPMFLQVVAISSGTLQIDINGDLATAQ